MVNEINGRTVKTSRYNKLTLRDLVGIIKIQIEIFVVWRHVKVVLDMEQDVIP